MQSGEMKRLRDAIERAKNQVENASLEHSHNEEWWNELAGITLNSINANLDEALIAVSEVAGVIAGYEEVLSSNKRLVRDLDFALNGSGASLNPSLCDIIAQVKREGIRSKKYLIAMEEDADR